MDFTSTYPHALGSSIHFSPGSTFLACISGASRCQVVVRVAGTLQVVRSWDLEEPLDALAWSQDGLYLLASAHGTKPDAATHNGVSYVLPLDPDAAVDDGSDDHRGWVARLAAGVQGLAVAAWLPIKRIPAVVQFFAFGGGAMVCTLADQGFTMLAEPRTPAVSGTAYDPDWWGVLQRHQDRDCLAIYAPASEETPALGAPVTWTLQFATVLPTSSAAGLLPSPDGAFWAVWDHMLDFQVALVTAQGTHIATISMDDDRGGAVTCSPLTKAEVGLALQPPPTSAGRARRVTLQPQARRAPGARVAPRGKAPPPSSAPSSRMSSSLGVRCVAWHPSSEFLAMGDYSGTVYVASRTDWTVSFTLRSTLAALRHERHAPHVWVEPHRWFEATHGQGIMSMEPGAWPSVLSVPAPPAAQSAQAGVSWLAWSANGTLLACRVEHWPTLLFVYKFEGFHARRVDAHLSLLAVLSFDAPLSCAMWKPGQETCLAITTGQQALFLWNYIPPSESAEDDSQGVQSADAIAIPNDGFAACRVAWAPDGHSLLLADAHTFCCVIPSQSDEPVAQDTSAADDAGATAVP